MTVRHAVVAVVTVAAFACDHQPASPPLDHLADGTVALSHRGLHPVSLQATRLVADPIIGDPRHLVVQGNTLWISDHSGDPYLHAVNLTTGAVAFSRGRHGEGPGDFAEGGQFSLRPGDDSAIWAYDAQLKRMTREVADPKAPLLMVHPPEQFMEVNSYLWLSADRLVGVGDMDTNRLIFSDPAGRLRSLVKADLLGADSIPILARRSASSGFSTCVEPRHGAIAILYQLGGRIDLFDSNGVLQHHADVPFPTNGEWAPSPSTHVLRPQAHWFYYIDCYATPKYLYALFAGHRTDGPHGGRVRAARYVHVFDWTGKLITVLALQHEMSAIAVAGDTVLFAAGQQGEGIFAYRLPEQVSHETAK